MPFGIFCCRISAASCRTIEKSTIHGIHYAQVFPKNRLDGRRVFVSGANISKGTRAKGTRYFAGYWGGTISLLPAEPAADGKVKAKLDKAIAAELAATGDAMLPWRLHDLRRTAASR